MTVAKRRLPVGTVTILALIGGCSDHASVTPAPRLGEPQRTAELGPTQSPFLDIATYAARRGHDRGRGREYSGTVVRKRDGMPIAFADIEARIGDYVDPAEWKSDDVDAVSGQSDASGRFRLQTAMKVDVAAHVDGFGWEYVTIDGREPADATVQLELEPIVLLEGRVVDADGEPAQFVTVGALGLGRPSRYGCGPCGNAWHAFQHSLGDTDAVGHFGPIECYARGVAALLVQDAERFDVLFPSISLEADPGAARFVELRQPPRVELAGRVAYADGTPAQDVGIVVTRDFDHWSDRWNSVGVGDEGSYVVRVPAAGSYRVEVIRYDAARTVIASCAVVASPGSTIVDFIHLPPATEVPIATVDEQDTAPEAIDEETDADEDGSATAVESATIRGFLSCDDAARYSHQIVVGLLRDGVVVTYVDCDEHGSFSLESVAPGDYVFATLGGSHEEAATPVHVEAGQTIVLPDRIVAELPRWRGRVVTADGAPVADVRVDLGAELAHASGPSGAEPIDVDGCMTDDHGEFTLAAFSGSGVVEVELEGDDPEVVRLAAPPRDDLVIRVPGLRTVMGRLVVPGGVPDHDLGICCEGVMGRELRRAEIKSDGQFELQCVTTEEFDLVLRRAPIQYNPGIEVARRRVAKSSAALDLGLWDLTRGAR